MWVRGTVVVRSSEILLLLGVLSAGNVLAHGVSIQWSIGEAVVVEAAFDDGSPLSGAEVDVYLESDPSSPCLTGTCDQSGRFILLPDSVMYDGIDIRVMKDGHGGWIHIQTATGMEGTEVRSGGISTPRKLVMAASVIWGLVGTALFFRSRQRSTSAPS
jgi:nickel transport protein